MNVLTILILVLTACVLGAMGVIAYGLSWAERHFEQHEDPVILATWEVTTDDFNTVKDCLESGRLVSLELIWSWRKFTWLYRFAYQHKYFVGYDPY